MAWHEHIRTIKQPSVLEYKLTIWGELIYGTQQQLHALGIGIGAQFPTTERKTLRMMDPRGLETEIHYSPCMGEGIYSASIHYPERKFTKDELDHFSPGVRVRELVGFNKYLGDADAMVESGLIRRENLPGQPGMGKVKVTLYPDGTLKTSRNGHERRRPGTTIIQRVSKTSYMVLVYVSEEERELRREAYVRREDIWERKMAALPRPEPLRPLAAEAVLSRQIEHARQDRHFQAFLGGLTN